MSRRRISDSLAVAIILTFLVWKFSHLAFRFGDGNAYLYMAEVLRGGLLPYRDFFLADPPFLVLFLEPFVWLFQSHLLWMQALPVVLEAGAAVFLYLVARGTRYGAAAWFAPVIYLSSFAVLATSDFLTGIQLVMFLLALGLWCQKKNWLLVAGICWSLAILTKLYALPLVLGFVAALVIARKWRELRRIFFGMAIATAVVLGPFLVISFSVFFKTVIIHHLNRPHGLSKLVVWGFFIAKHWGLLALAVMGMFLARRWNWYFPLAFAAIFLLVFQDLYFVYLQVLLLPIIFFALDAFSWLTEKIKQNSSVALLVAVSFFFPVAVPAFAYFDDFQERGRFLNAPKIAATIADLPQPWPLFGSHEVAPLLALLSGRPLFGNVIDTNPQAFASGGLNREEVTQAAVAEGVYLVGRFTKWPQWDGKTTGYEGYFAVELFEKYCEPIRDFVSLSREQDNVIGIFECKQN